MLLSFQGLPLKKSLCLAELVRQSLYFIDIMSLEHFILTFNTGFSSPLDIPYVLSETFILFGLSASHNDLTAAKMLFSQYPLFLIIILFLFWQLCKMPTGLISLISKGQVWFVCRH